MEPDAGLVQEVQRAGLTGTIALKQRRKLSESGPGAERTEAAPIISRFSGQPQPAADSSAGSAAHLDRAQTPAIPRVDAPLHHIAAAIVIVGIVVSVVLIAVAIIIIIGIVETVSYAGGKRGERKTAMAEAVMETSAAETTAHESSVAKSGIAKSRTADRG
jgi:hypothetical protein